jgi:hypothetical protein
MNRWMWSLIAAVGVLAMAVLLSACGDETTKPLPGENWSNDSPEEVVATLIDSYRRREIASYAPLLHPDFRFYFQDGDEPPDLGRDYWTAAEDSTGTAALFSSLQVSDIYIDLTYGAAVLDSLERSPDPVMKIRVTPMKLTVDDRSGTTYLVEGDIEDFFFVRGAGADSTSWYLYEWHDIRGGGGIGAPGVQDSATQTNSWGMIKTMFWTWQRIER